MTNSMSMIEDHIDDDHPEEDGDYRTLRHTVGKGKCPWCKWKCGDGCVDSKGTYDHIDLIHGRLILDAFMAENPISSSWDVGPSTTKSIGTTKPMSCSPPALGHQVTPVDIVGVKTTQPIDSIQDTQEEGESSLPFEVHMEFNDSAEPQKAEPEKLPVVTNNKHEEPMNIAPSEEEVDPDDLIGHFSCVYCKVETSRQLLFEAHLREHPAATTGGISIYQCATCPWGSTSARKVQQHSVAKHDITQDEDICSVIDIEGEPLG